MEYGLEAINNANVVTVSNNFRIQVFHERGQFTATSANSNTPGYATVYFARPVRTPPAPELYLRLASANRPNVSLYIVMLGAPGNWTGFSVVIAAAGVNNLISHVFEYVIGKFSNEPGPDNYGMELYAADGSGQVIYTSYDKPVIFDRFTKRWRYVTQSGAGIVVWTYTSDMAIASGDFIGVSRFNRGVVHYGGASYAGLTLMAGGALTLGMTINVNAAIYSRFTDPRLGAAFNFCLPICKFPQSVYFNS